ncbi:tetratricopeptide repeat protein [Bdellovibrio bacteriovorus]|uniref:HTH cro/C1-type domain-containing protein n=1 Tax=Bdellovibrio bacteriovorus str. Tiberius TaxID=1069642 RepID=K7Z8N6_BDEBC|nr:tetratricopeptide repeat protein [Bdellovibrio bacteriovorus]AFY00814.1 hypothetical protein Bdt_1114 [Bdellovibrio bacteriovorus str. Tiberius]
MREILVEIDGQYLMETLKNAGIANITFARSVGVNVKTVQRWIHGQVKRVTVSTAEKILAALPCDRQKLVLPDSETKIVSQDPTLATLLDFRFINSLETRSQLLVLFKSLKTFSINDLSTKQFALLYSVLGFIHLKIGSIRAAKFHLTSSVTTFRKVDDKENTGWALYYLAVVRERVGEYQEALNHLESIRNVYAYSDDLAVRMHHLQGKVFSSMGSTDQAEDSFRSAIKVAKEQCLWTDELQLSYYRLGWIQMQKGLFDKAIWLFLRSFVVSRKNEDGFAQLISYRSYKVACTLLGRCPKIGRINRLINRESKLVKTRSQREIVAQIDFYMALAERNFELAQSILNERAARSISKQSTRTAVSSDTELMRRIAGASGQAESFTIYLNAI